MKHNMDVCGNDAMQRQEIVDSCRVIKTHASFVGVAAGLIARMPDTYTPGCMDELNEAMGVLQRALDRIEKAKDQLMRKIPQAAE